MGKTPERPPQPEQLPQYLSRIVLAEMNAGGSCD